MPANEKPMEVKYLRRDSFGCRLKAQCGMAPRTVATSAAQSSIGLAARKTNGVQFGPLG